MRESGKRLEGEIRRADWITRGRGTTRFGMSVQIVDMNWRRKDGVELDFVQPGSQMDECIVSATTLKWRRQQKDDAIKF